MSADLRPFNRKIDERSTKLVRFSLRLADHALTTDQDLNISAGQRQRYSLLSLGAISNI